MSGDGDEKIIGINRPVSPPSPADVLANPRQFLHSERHAARPERVIRERPADQPPPDDAAYDDGGNPGGGPESFDAESSDYKAFGWAGNKTLPILRVILKDGSEWPIIYAHLDTNPLNGSQFLPRPPGRKGNLILLRVVGHDGVFMVVIEGIRLRRVWELLMGHKTPWIHELPEGADFVGDDGPVIWSVTARGPIKPERAS